MAERSPTTPSADEVRGGFRVMDDFMNVTEALFERFYKSLYRNRKTIVETDKLRKASLHTRTVQRELRTTKMDLLRVTQVLAVIDEGIILQDHLGGLVLMNEAARQLVGGAKNFWDSPLGQMFRENSVRRTESSSAGRIEPFSTPQRVEINEKAVGARIAAVYSEKGEILGTVMILSDFTHQSLAEKLKTSFITQMSHELLTPLTSIKGMSDIVLNLPEGKPPDRRFLEAISRNVAIMDRMVVELLDISEISAGNFNIHRNPLRLEHQVAYVLQGLESRLRKAKLNVIMRVVNREALQFLGDERRIQWALGHLIDNAINYTEPNGKIFVEVGRVRDGELILKVRDTGVGISKDDLPHIFDRFYRGKAKTPEGKLIDPRGLGQGLYIAQAVITAHGGSISVASKLGEGSTFTIALPLAG